MSTRCPICESRQITLIQNDVKAGSPYRGQALEAFKVPRTPIKVFRCKDCVFDFLETWEDTEKVTQFYENNHYICRPNIDPGHRKYDEALVRIERVKPYLTSKTRLLDIGCGDGDFLKRAKPYVKKAHGMEITKKHVEDLRQDGISVWECLINDFFPDKPYDMIVMHALLEHVPRVSDFLNEIKRISHDRTLLFIELPNVRDPLAYYFGIEAYRKFFYREYHLYYFSEVSLKKLLAKHGFHSEIQPLLVASLTNHFNWLHQNRGQETTNDMVNVTFPAPLAEITMPNGESLPSLFNRLDDIYRHEMTRAGIGDLLVCRAWPAGLNP